jgi:class 3 adenylate cyclase
MFADVSGFTALSEKMARYGPEGAEYLAKHLNSYFSQMVKIIASMGGDIFKVCIPLVSVHCNSTARNP